MLFHPFEPVINLLFGVDQLFARLGVFTFGEQFEAFRRFHEKHPDSILSVHSLRAAPTGLNLLRMALDADPARRPTLTTVHRELTGWLASGGHSENGPVTVVTMGVSARQSR